MVTAKSNSRFLLHTRFFCDILKYMQDKLAIGIDLGASNIRVALALERGKILNALKEPTDKSGKDGTVVTKQIIRMIKELQAKAKQKKKITGIGVASFGPLDYKKGGPKNSPNVPYDFIPLVKPLEREFKLPIFLHNDANVAALAEQCFGAGKNKRNIVYVTISTGIGGGAIVDDHLLLGRGGNAAEVGHIIVDTKYNIPCTCKKGIGHWEGLASGTNIPKFFEIWRRDKSTGTVPVDLASVMTTGPEVKVIFAMAAKSESFALDFLEELSRINARAISTLISVYDPELITIGGSVALNNPEFIIGGIKKYVEHYLEIPDIKLTRLGDEIGALGAAATVFKKIKPSLEVK